MELLRVRVKGRILIRPKNKSDLNLFRHCSEGMIRVSTKFYNSNVEPLLLLHGISYISTTDLTGKGANSKSVLFAQEAP